MRKLPVAGLSLLLLLSPTTYGYESYFESTNSLAKGGVEGSYWDSLQSGFNLPHELYRVKQFDLFLRVNGQISEKTYELILNPPEAKEGELDSKFSKYFGEKYFGNANASAGFNYRSFIIVPYYRKVRTSAQLNYKVYPEATGFINDDTGWMIGTGQKISRFLFGLNYLNFQRDYDIYTVDLISSLNESYEEKHQERLESINASLGYQLSDKTNHQETVFVNFKNLNHPNNQSNYDAYNGDLIPLINLGYQLHHDRWSFEADLLDLNNYYLGLWQNRIRLGAEYQFSQYALVRSISTGILDGSLSLGTSLNLFRFININLATYEKNLYNFYEKKSRFYSVGLEINF